MVKKLVQVGDPVIRSKAKKVAVIKGKPIQKLLTDLTDTLRATGLVGIAAPQIGAGQQVFLTEIRATKFRKNLKDLHPLMVFINPKIISQSKEQSILVEGCGSLAEAKLFGPVKRARKVKVKALNAMGKPFTLEASGLLAKVIQHELDHLNGVVIIDKFTDTKKVMDSEIYRNA